MFLSHQNKLFLLLVSSIFFHFSCVEETQKNQSKSQTDSGINENSDNQEEEEEDTDERCLTVFLCDEYDECACEDERTCLDPDQTDDDDPDNCDNLCLVCTHT
jgi:hypothetical protein